METSPRPSPSGTAATVISLWGAMLGGAMGATVGLFGGGAFISALIGFMFGFIASVITVSILLALSYFLAAILGTEFEDQPIGCSTTSQLSGILGGLGGALGAAVLAEYGMSRFQARSSTFGMCWSVAACLPMILILLVVRLSRFRLPGPEGPAWLHSLVARVAGLLDRVSARIIDLLGARRTGGDGGL